MRSSEAKPKGGRPRNAVRRVPLSLRVTPEVRSRLDDLARDSGRSISQEAEFRLEQSFKREDLLPDVLALAYGDPLAGFLMALGETIKMMALNRYLAQEEPAEGTLKLRAMKFDNVRPTGPEAATVAGRLFEFTTVPDAINDFVRYSEASGGGAVTGLHGITDSGGGGAVSGPHNFAGSTGGAGANAHAAVNWAAKCLLGCQNSSDERKWRAIRALIGLCSAEPNAYSALTKMAAAHKTNLPTPSEN